LGHPTGFDYPDYGYYDDNAGDYSEGQSSPAAVTLSQDTVVAVQQQLSQLGYYDGPIDGLIGPQTAKAVRRFQSRDNLSVTGQIDSPTLRALGDQLRSRKKRVCSIGKVRLARIPEKTRYRILGQ
jgi:peptidoglycan hydrolase-like protein with peptidoglycan-binding domain